MFNLFTSIIVTIIFVVLFIKIDDEFWGGGAAFGALCGAVWFVVCLCMTLGSRNGWLLSEQSKIKYIETRKALMYCMQANPNSVRTLASDIADYNTEVLKGRRRNASPWFDWETYDFWDELELIEMPDKPLQ